MYTYVYMYMYMYMYIYMYTYTCMCVLPVVVERVCVFFLWCVVVCVFCGLYNYILIRMHFFIHNYIHTYIQFCEKQRDKAEFVRCLLLSNICVCLFGGS